MENEEYFRKVIGKSMRSVAENLVKTKEFSEKYYARDDRKAVDEEIRKISEELSEVFVKNLKREGFLGDKSPSKEDFSRILKSSVEEYMGEKHENDNKPK